MENEVKVHIDGFLSMLAAKIDASLLGNVLASKGVVRDGDGVIRAG